MALPFAPIVYAVGAAALGAAGGIAVERVINPGATREEYVVAGAVGAIPGAGLGIKGGLAGVQNLNRFRKMLKAGQIPNVKTGALILAHKGTRFPYASGRPLVVPVIMGGAVQYIATAAYGKLTQSRGGEHTASSGTPVTRKSRRGPSAQKRSKRKSKTKKSREAMTPRQQYYRRLRDEDYWTDYGAQE